MTILVGREGKKALIFHHWFFSGRSRDHFLHARACYMMKQNSPNCLLCPNESFPSKGFYLMHMHSKHNIEVDAMLCISCGISTSIFEYLPRHQIKCFQVLCLAIIACYYSSPLSFGSVSDRGVAVSGMRHTHVPQKAYLVLVLRCGEVF